MIPKTIHYCWFGGKPLPHSAQKCIDSWRKFMPGYTIKRWDESNFNVNAIPYTRAAYSRKLYAFVSYFARFWILDTEGGIYLDTDIEIIKSLDDIVERGPYLGIEGNHFINPGLGMAAEPNMPFLEEMIEFYRSNSLYRKDGSINFDTVVLNTTCRLEGHGWTGKEKELAGFKIYPSDYFCPLNYQTGKLEITENTYSIHHHKASWLTWKMKLYRKCRNLFGNKFVSKCSGLLKTLAKRRRSQ